MILMCTFCFQPYPVGPTVALPGIIGPTTHQGHIVGLFCRPYGCPMGSPREHCHTVGRKTLGLLPTKARHEFIFCYNDVGTRYYMYWYLFL